jgi:hypothetical protein
MARKQPIAGDYFPLITTICGDLNQFIRITSMVIDQFEGKIKLIQSLPEIALICACRTALKKKCLLQLKQRGI